MSFRDAIYRLQEIVSKVSGEQERKEALEILNELVRIYNRFIYNGLNS